MISIKLEPLGISLKVRKDTALRDILFDYGVEFPCGGQGLCRGCIIKVLEGEIPISDYDRQALTKEEIKQGLRLACHARVKEPLVIELAQWNMNILSDDSRIRVKPREGLGIVVDLGTTTIVIQLLDLRSGNVLGVRTILNPQARFGADIMSRIEFALKDKGAKTLRDLVRSKIRKEIDNLLCNTSLQDELPLLNIVLVGNTAMHHLFCGIDTLPLSRYPFEPVNDGVFHLSAESLGWKLPGNPTVTFLPCLGGFVGSDILAGILAIGMHESSSLIGLIDLGTNGEVVFGNKDKIVCASTAAGPAFEGAKISMGKRATTGAISRVKVNSGKLECSVIGNVVPDGICGSGLVDAIAAGLKLGHITSRGKLTCIGGKFTILNPVSISQADIRETQLAKGAIAAGVELLLKRINVKYSEIDKVHLAGAFGNYIDPVHAVEIGLCDFAVEKLESAGNTALKGAKIALFESDGNFLFEDLLSRIEHVPLAADPMFQDVFVENMLFR